MCSGHVAFRGFRPHCEWVRKLKRYTSHVFPTGRPGLVGFSECHVPHNQIVRAHAGSGRRLPVKPPRSRKALWLLALLTLRLGASCDREWLSSMLWLDSDRTQALGNLRTCLSELRSALGNEGKRLEAVDRHTVHLDLREADVDVLDFDRFMSVGKRAELEQAVALYKGPLLEGSNEEWVAQERGAREQDCLAALQTLGETSLSAGDFRAAVGWYRRATVLDSWWDAAHRGLMEALAADGSVNEALHVYRTFEERLRSESATAPDPQTTSVYMRLRKQVRGGQAAAPVKIEAAVGHIPHPISEIVGREDEGLEVAILLRRTRLVTLTGLGGIGKTTLAIAVATAVAPEFSDGCWFVSLDGISDSELVARQIGAVLGLAERAGETPLQAIVDQLRSKRALVILDNCEHLLNACAWVCSHLLQECPGVRILATSREILGITGESVWAVPTLPVPNPRDLPVGPASRQRAVSGYEGVNLFLERARAANRTFTLDSSNVQSVAEICYGLEGLPLAIELAAAHTRTLSLPEIATRLRDHLDLLTGSARTVSPRQHTMRSTLDWSYDLLTEAERTLLGRLSVFVGGWTLAAAEQVCSGGGIEAQDIPRCLGLLIEKSLISFITGRADTVERYRMLETVRQYAVQKLAKSDEQEAIEARHRAWCMDLAQRADAEIFGPEQTTWLRILDVEHGNLLKALIGFENDPEGGMDGLRTVTGMSRLWVIRGPRSEGRERLHKALEHLGAQADTSERAYAQNLSGILAFHEDRAAAESHFLASIATMRSMGERRRLVSPLSNLAAIYGSVGNHKASLSGYAEAIELAREFNVRAMLALTLHNKGYLLLEHLGEAQQAKLGFEESERVYREAGEPYGISYALFGLGFAETALGNYEAARAHYEEGIAIKEEIQDQVIGRTWMRLGELDYQRGDLPSAKDYLDRAMIELTTASDEEGIATTARCLGYVHWSTGNLNAAEHKFRSAFKLFRKLDVPRDAMRALAGSSVVSADLAI